MEYEWYADIFFLTNLFMDFTGILAAAVSCNRPLRWKRTVLFCSISVVVSMILMIKLSNYLIYRLIVHIVINPLMMAFIFKPEGWSEFFRMLLTVYLIFFLAGGVQESFLLQVGRGGGWQILLCGIFAIAAWLIYMRRFQTLKYVCTVDLWLNGEKITVAAFCDSGNMLSSPTSGKPVSILQEEAVRCWNTEELKKEQVCYHTVSEKQGYLQVVTLDKMDIYMRGTTRQINAPAIGLYAGTLMERLRVQMLLPNAYMS